MILFTQYAQMSKMPMTDEEFLVQIKKDIAKANKTVSKYLKKFGPEDDISYYSLIMDLHRIRGDIDDKLNKVNL